MLDPLSTVAWMTVARIVVGLVLLGITACGVYKFKAGLLTVMGLLLISNLVCLYLIMGLLS